MTRLAVISKAEAKRLLVDAEFRRDVFGDDPDDPDFLAWQHEWLSRIAGGWTVCDCRHRHRDACSSQPCGINQDRCSPSTCGHSQIEQEALF